MKYEKNDIVLAILGQTKFGKTTLLALLSCIFPRFFRIFSKSGGRTQTLTEYWYDKDNNNKDIMLLDIEVWEKECLGGFINDVEAYNNNLKVKPALVKGLGLQPLPSGGNPKEYLKKKLDELKHRPITDEELEKLISTRDLDSCIRKITVRVPANAILKAFMEEKNVRIIIRDTKGLLDFSVDAGLIKSNANLTEIGLDKIDGAIFGCSDSYPNVIQEIYADTLRTVFESIPIFLLARDQRMFHSFGKKGNFTEDEVDKYIKGIQEGKNPDYEDAEALFFNDTNELFEQLGIMHRENGEYVFSEVYWGKDKTIFLFPTAATLKKFGLGKTAEDDELIEADDVKFLQMVVSVAIKNMVSLISDFRESKSRLIHDGYAEKYMRDAAELQKSELLEDFDKYDNAPQGPLATSYCKPQLDYVSQAKILASIDDSETAILGPRDGITTQANNKLKYYSTAVVAVTAKKWLDRIIEKVKVPEDIRDKSTGELLFPELSGNLPVQEKCVKSVLHNCLLNEYTDTQATVQHYLCVDRYKAKMGIEKRRMAPALPNAFEQTVDIIVDDFCGLLGKNESGSRY